MSRKARLPHSRSMCRSNKDVRQGTQCQLGVTMSPGPASGSLTTTPHGGVDNAGCVPPQPNKTPLTQYVSGVLIRHLFTNIPNRQTIGKHFESNTSARLTLLSGKDTVVPWRRTTLCNRSLRPWGGRDRRDCERPAREEIGRLCAPPTPVDRTIPRPKRTVTLCDCCRAGLHKSLDQYRPASTLTHPPASGSAQTFESHDL